MPERLALVVVVLACCGCAGASAAGNVEGRTAPSPEREKRTDLFSGLAGRSIEGTPEIGSVPFSPGLGRPVTPEEVERWDIDVMPSGEGLPRGGGTAAEGGALFAEHCASCHGPRGIGGTAVELTGGRMPLTSEHPDKTIGRYWPYATTVFDFIRRSMPMTAPGTLDADAVYALTAFLLSESGVIDPDEEMNADTLPRVRMPNRDGFIRIHPASRERRPGRLGE